MAQPLCGGAGVPPTMPRLVESRKDHFIVGVVLIVLHVGGCRGGLLAEKGGVSVEGGCQEGGGSF